jgi:tetratricopeptide (TPR) repeat protein
VEGEIQRRFHKSGSDTADLLFSWALKTFEQKNYAMSLDVLDQVIMLKPDFAEAWNKRATVHYMLDDYSESLSDIRQALLLEPRHFGALSGLGIILDASGRKPDALKALRRALEINPQMEQVKKTVERLEKETSGQSI